MPTKVEAIRILISGGHDAAARELKQWRNKDGQNGGWDKWFVSRDGFPNLERILWPDGY